MSHGHGKMELFILATLTTERGGASAALLAGLHPDARHFLPSRSLRSSLGRALRRLESAGRIERIEFDGLIGWRLNDYPGDRRRTAYHEAGHAVIAKVLSLPVKYATIKPSKGTLGHVQMGASFYKNMSKEDHSNNALMTLAGRFAESYFEQDVLDGKYLEKMRRHGARVDRKHVRSAVTNIVGELCNDGKHLLVFKPAWRSLRAKLERKARQLVHKHKAAIDRVAQKLIKHETLSSAQLDVIIAAVESAAAQSA